MTDEAVDMEIDWRRCKHTEIGDVVVCMVSGVKGVITKIYTLTAHDADYGAYGRWAAVSCAIYGNKWRLKMEVRPIDGNALIEWFSPYLHTDEPIPADVVIEDIRFYAHLSAMNEPLKLEDAKKNGIFGLPR